jgi:hypothetical protein
MNPTVLRQQLFYINEKRMFHRVDRNEERERIITNTRRKKLLLKLLQKDYNLSEEVLEIMKKKTHCRQMFGKRKQVAKPKPKTPKIDDFDVKT